MKNRKLHGNISRKMVFVISFLLSIMGIAGYFSFAAIIPTRIIVGAYTPTYGEFVNFQTKMGIKLDSFLWYSAITQNFDTNLGSLLAQNNQSLQLALEPRNPGYDAISQPAYSLKSITSGLHDAEIRSWAKQLKAYNRTVYLRPMSEMNGNWATWCGTVNGNQPADYVPAWKHMHDVFVSEGVTNVLWIWSVNNVSVPNTAANAISVYFPGDKYVDYVGIGGYNWNTPWISFKDVFQDSYTKVTSLSTKGVVITETAAPEDLRKPAWIADMATTVKSSFPRVTQVYWFSANKEQDWRIDSSTSSMNAFVSAVTKLHGLVISIPKIGPSLLPPKKAL